MTELSDGLRAARLPKLVGGSSSTAIIVVLTVAGLYVGRQVLIPLALAVLLSFMLAPLVSLLQRRHVPKAAAVIGVVAITFAAIFGFGFVVAGQVTQLAQNLPSYQSNIQNKVRALNLNDGMGGLFGGVSQMMQTLSNDVTPAPQPAVPAGALPATTIATPAGGQPVPVEIIQPNPSPFQIVETVLGPLITPLVTFGIVVLVVIVILLQRQDLRDRFIRLAGAGDINRTTQALEDAGARVARYLLTQVVVNLSYGVPVGIGLWLIGVPNPLLWGSLAVVLRFVPYVGPILAATPPVALSIAVDPHWTMLPWTLGLFVVLETITGNVLEPWLYGARTGLSPVAIIVAAIFWTWLWGPVGLLLSTPLTVCVVVLGRHVPQFAFLEVLLGSDPVLTREESLHQRLLALNPDEATENAEEYLKEHSLEEFYDQVAIPALVSIEGDRASGVLVEDRRAMVADGIATLIENLSDAEDAPPAVATDPATAVAGADALPVIQARFGPEHGQALCIGGRGNLDDAAAAILSQLLERRGLRSRALSWVDVNPANLARIDRVDVRVVCLVYLNEDSSAHARYLVRRLRRRMPEVAIVVTLLAPVTDEPSRSQTQAEIKADGISTSLIDTLDKVGARIGATFPTPSTLPVRLVV